jgi:hypothetical protein
MNPVEKKQFFDRRIRGLWPQWEPTDAETCVWMSELEPLDERLAWTAIRACFSDQGANYHRPVLRKFLEKVRALSQRASGPRPERIDPQTNVFIECLDPPADRPHLADARKPVYVHPASRQTDSEYVQACAEHMRTKFAQLYGGHWIVVVTRPRPDDGLRGDPARQRAYTLILEGPDTPGKRHLQEHLANKPPAPLNDDPSPLGACCRELCLSEPQTEASWSHDLREAGES